MGKRKRKRATYMKKKPRQIDGVAHWLCSKCKEWIPQDEMGRSCQAMNGVHSQCKQCIAADSRVRRMKYNDRFRRQYRERYRRDPTAILERHARRRREYPEKAAAVVRLNDECKAGRIVRPDHCEMCGEPCVPHGHHDSYDRDRWLVVTWLCAQCHSWLHAKKGAR